MILQDYSLQRIFWLGRGPQARTSRFPRMRRWAEMEGKPGQLESTGRAGRDWGTGRALTSAEGVWVCCHHTCLKRVPETGKGPIWDDQREQSQHWTLEMTAVPTRETGWPVIHGVLGRVLRGRCVSKVWSYQTRLVMCSGLAWRFLKQDSKESIYFPVT